MIIFLNGSINAGKSTIAKLLAKELSKTAVVEIDTLRSMIDWIPLIDSIPLNLENAVSVIRNFVNKDLNVIVPYPLSQENYHYIMNSLHDLKTAIHVFTLDPTLEKSLTNRGSRELTEWEIERINHHYSSGLVHPSFGEIIDNSLQAPDDTAKYILNKINTK